MICFVIRRVLEIFRTSTIQALLIAGCPWWHLKTSGRIPSPASVRSFKMIQMADGAFPSFTFFFINWDICTPIVSFWRKIRYGWKDPKGRPLADERDINLSHRDGSGNWCGRYNKRLFHWLDTSQSNRRRVSCLMFRSMQPFQQMLCKLLSCHHSVAGFFF